MVNNNINLTDTKVIFFYLRYKILKTCSITNLPKNTNEETPMYFLKLLASWI